jgi:hypothetical protein
LQGRLALWRLFLFLSTKNAVRMIPLFPPEERGGLSMNEIDMSSWSANWMWSLPLIVVTVLFHTVCLALVNRRVTRAISNVHKNRVPPQLVAMRVMGTTVLTVTMLHGVEALGWAFAFVWLGALPERKIAMLYSMSAMTTYGHANLYLKPQWQMMGALEALNGMILFGLTTAFLFLVIQQVWPHVAHGQAV